MGGSQSAPNDNELTRLLSAAADGNPQAAADLLPLVYEELRGLARARMAGQPADHTLSATALVHEAYVRLVGADADAQHRPGWNGRGHFFAAAAQAMRCILVDRARRYQRDKHGAGFERRQLPAELSDAARDASELVALDEAISALEQVDARKARVVVLRYFAGLSIDEAAEALNLSPATVKNEWLFARAWLHRRLAAPGDDAGVPR